MPNVQLEFAVEQFKREMAKTKQSKSNDWKKAYLNRITLRTMTTNRSVK